MSDQTPPPEIPDWMKVVWKWDDSIGQLRIFILFDCAVNSFKALLEEAGPNKTLEAIKPFNKNIGNTMQNGVKQRFGPQGNDAEAVALPYYWFHYGTSNGNIKPMEIRDGMAIVEVGSCPCPQFNAPPELCVAISHYISEGLSEAVNPEYEFVWTHHLVNDDEYCRYVVKKKSIRYDPANLGKLEKTVSLDISKQEMGALATMVAWSQMNICKLASVSLIGSKRTIELAEPLAKKSGMKLGTQLIEGEKGSVKLEPDLVIKTTTREGTTVETIQLPKYSWDHPRLSVEPPSIVACNHDILQDILGKHRAETTGEDNFKTVQLVFSAYESARTNQVINF